MHAKVQASSKNDGNRGSCRGLVYYLEKEDREVKRESVRDLVYYLEKESRAVSTGNGSEKQAEPFFSHHEDNVPAEKVIQAIDNNTKKLGKADSKFFEVYISPSEAELKHIGNDVNKLRDFIRAEVMEAYAAGFGERAGKGLTAEALIYFGKIEHERRYKGNDPEVRNGNKESGEVKKGLNMHVHVIVSRKDITGKIKLSPMASEKGDKGNAMLNGKVVQRGFDRNAFSERVEKSFDRKFELQRSLQQSFAFLNAMKNGTITQKAEMRKAELETIYASKLEKEFPDKNHNKSTQQEAVHNLSKENIRQVRGPSR